MSTELVVNMRLESASLVGRAFADPSEVIANEVLS